MSQEIAPISRRQLDRLGLERLPVAIAAAGKSAAWRFIEFFTANIRNKNTRAAYAEAVGQFFQWCESRGVNQLDQIRPVLIASYIEELQTIRSAPTVKQHLAAVRMLFDWLVIGQIMPMNPASSVRGPKYSIKRGKTPVLVKGGVKIDHRGGERVDHFVGNGCFALRDLRGRLERRPATRFAGRA
jgi:integrase/recombinase XerD